MIAKRLKTKEHDNEEVGPIDGIFQKVASRIEDSLFAMTFSDKKQEGKKNEAKPIKLASFDMVSLDKLHLIQHIYRMGL
jgi:hypothetical protein